MEESETFDKSNINELLALCAGADMNGEGLRVTDGSRGVVYMTGEGENTVRHGVCMPSPCALGCSFDKELVREVGKAVGSIANDGGYNAVLSPDAGIVRSPLYGSLADRFGEDPYLNGTLVSEWISGAQSEGVTAVLSHFAGGSQSSGKFTCDNMIDKRALFDLYLKPFEMAIRQSSPRAVSVGINKINGLASCENPVLLTDILRRQWGFEGAVLADLRTADSGEAMASGVDMSFPEGGRLVRRRLKKALRDEIIPPHYPGLSAERIRTAATFSPAETAMPMMEEEYRSLAVKAAEACAVLLKNHRNTLPLPLSGSIALIGRQAKYMRLQRRGIHTVDSGQTLNMLNVFDDNQVRYKYSEGYGPDSAYDDDLLAEAAKCAAEAEFAIVFVGFDDAYDNACADRFTNRLSKIQTKLINVVSKANQNTVVIVGGSALPKLNWIGKVKAVLYLPLGGDGTAQALYNLLFGFANPCGRLPVSYSLSETDMPCCDTFNADPEMSEHRESIYVGYRYYNKAGIFPAFSFGYGMSYTRFEYANMKVAPCSGGWEVTVDIRNTGNRDGYEIVQFYVEPPKGEKLRPVRELKQFRKVWLPKGEKRTVSVMIPRTAFESYSIPLGRSYIPGGRYRIRAAASSIDSRAEVWINVKGEPALKYELPGWYTKPSGRPNESDFLEIFGDATTRKQLPTEKTYSVDNTLQQLASIGLFRAAVHLIRFFADRIIPADSRRDPAYAERMDIALNMPVRRLCGLCRGFYPMKLTRLVIAVANRRGRKRK